MSRFILGVTGASGAIYAARTLWHLQKLGHSVSLIFTEMGKSVAEFEGQIEKFKSANCVLDVHNLFADCASGSSDFSGMAVVPCSMGTLGKMANGIADNLLVRAADVCLKERRPLVVVPREMPFSLIHLQNMEKRSLAGASIVAASPSFYRKPTTIDELVDSVVAKILSQLHLPNEIVSDSEKVR